MESVHGNNGGSRLVVTELSHIKQLVTQLELHLAESPDLCKRLASQIFSLTEHSLAIITSSNFHAGLTSATPSPISDVVDAPPFKSNKKRKTTARKHQVRVSAAEGGEAPVDDGHSWRKYGQKTILGAQYPRSYYRCRHRHTQGCAAMKKVQRADEDPALFDVIYHGAHTCVETTAAPAAAGQLPTPPAPSEEHNPDAGSLLQSLSGNIVTVKTEGIAAATEPQGWNNDITPCFCPSSTSPLSWCLWPTALDIAEEFVDVDVISSFFS